MRLTRRNIAVLGSTGSIGLQTLDIIAEYPDRFAAWLLVADLANFYKYARPSR